MNQTFKKKVIAASVSSVFAIGAAASVANVFEASVPNSYTASTVVLKTGATTPKWLMNGGTNTNGLYGVSESGTWNSSSSAPIAARVTLPAGVDIWGAAVGTSLTATAGITNTGVDVSALLTAGTTYDIKKTTATALAGNTLQYAFAYVDTSTDGNWAANKQYALFGLIGTELQTTGSPAFAPASLANGTATTTATVYTGQTGVALAAGMTALTNQGVTIRTSTGGLTTTGNDKIGKLTKNSDGTTTMVLYVSAPDTTGGNNQFVLPALPVSATAAATTGAMAVGLKDGSSDTGADLMGLTTTSQTVATVTSNLVSVEGSASGVTLPVIPTGATAAQAMGNLKITFADTTSTSSDSYLYVTLNNGAKFKTGVTGATFGNGTTTAVDQASTGEVISGDSTVTVNSSGQLVIQIPALAALAAGDQITLTANSAVIDASSATAGTISATVTGAGTGLSSVGTQSVAIATAATKGVTTSFVDAGATGYTKLFTGRDTVTLTSGEGLKLVESAFGSIPTGGEVTLTLDSGAKFKSGNQLTATGTPTLTFTAPSASVTYVTGTNGTATSSTAGSTVLTNFQFDLANATAGDLSVTFSGSGNVSGKIKLAELTDATTASVGGALPTPAVSTSSVALPTITIAETAAGALVGAAQLDLVLDNGATWTTATGVTATASGGNGTLTGAVLAKTNIDNDTMRFTSAASASAATSFAIAGLKINTGTVSGPTGVTPQGTALPAKTKFTVASVVPSATPLIAPATVTGTTSSQTVTASIVPAGNDQGKLGSVYVAAILPSSLGGGAYFMGSTGAWTLFSSCTSAPAYSTSSLTSVPSISVASAMDVSGLIGTQIYVGYGVGGPLSPAGTACNYMLNNGTYNLSYTVK